MATANLFIDWGGEFHTPPFKAIDYLPIDGNGSTTILDLMTESKIKFTYKGSGDSAYLTSIDGVSYNQNENGYYWFFYVNNKPIQVGFGAYDLSDSDSVAVDYKHWSSRMKQVNQPDHPLNKK